MKLVALCRMSVAYDDLGNQRQEDAIRAYAQSRGHTVVAVKKDVMSATKFRLNDRPGWVEARDLVKAGRAEGVAIYHLDRLTRDNRDLEDVIDTKIPVVCASGEIDLTTDMGRTMARVLTAIAKGEVERKAARQRLANAQRFDMRLPWPGGPRAFGYTQNGMELIEEEAKAFRWAVQQALAEASLRSIARGLSTAGFKSSRAKHSSSQYSWTHGGIRKMLLSPRYAGVRRFNGQEIVGLWPALIEQDTHSALKKTLTDAKRDPLQGRAGRNSRRPSNLVSLIAVCGRCGQTLIAGRGGERPTYTCRSGKGCVFPQRLEVDDAVTDHILALLAQPQFLDALIPHSDDRVATAKKEIDKLARRLSVYNDAFNEGDYDNDMEEYKRATADLRDRLKAQHDLIDELSERELFFGEQWRLDVGTDAVEQQWDAVPLANRRRIIDRFLSVKVLPVGPHAPGARWELDSQLVVRRRRPAGAAHRTGRAGTARPPR